QDQVGFGYGMSGDLFNPYAILIEERNHSERARVLGSAYAQYEIFKDVTLRTSFGADLLSGRQEIFTPSTIKFAGESPTGDAATSTYLTWLNENTLTFSRSI